MTATPLDRAWRAAEADDAAMTRFWEVFAAAELHLAIDADTLSLPSPQPLIFPADGADTALVFDLEERLAAFMGGDAAHLTMAGRALVEMFAGRGVAIGLNLGEAPSATVLPAAALDWAAQILGQPLEEAEAAGAFSPPVSVDDALIARLDARLAGLGALVAEAWLCDLDGRPVLMPVLRMAEAEGAVVAALAETARFAGEETAAFDIAVLGAGDPRLESARRVGLGFEPPAPEAPVLSQPGMDPSKPPRLR